MRVAVSSVELFEVVKKKSRKVEKGAERESKARRAGGENWGYAQRRRAFLDGIFSRLWFARGSGRKIRREGEGGGGG